MSVIYNSVDVIKPKTDTGPEYIDKSKPSDLASKNEFLKLFTTQLQYQNPLDPMKNEDFTAQLAQFSSLEQLTQINQNLEDTLSTNLLLNRSINNNMATTLIGRQVKVRGNYVQINSGQTSDLLFDAGEEVKNVTIEITDANGRAVRNVELPILAAGPGSWSWDGKDNAGAQLDDGEYTFVIKGTNAEGKEVVIDGYATGIVSGVRYNGNETLLVCGENEFSISDVLEVKNITEDNVETESE